jgi:hypothetical protein
MRLSIGHAAAFVLATAVSATTVQSAAAPQRPAARTPPRPGQTTLEILSIPSGLRVHLRPDTATGGGADSGWADLVENNPVFAQASYRGVTPLVLRNLRPGRYVLAISPLTLRERDGRRSMRLYYDQGVRTRTLTNVPRDGSALTVDPALQVRAFISLTPLSTLERSRPTEDVSGAVVYSIEVDRPTRQRLLVLHSWVQPLEVLDSLYPRDAVFRFDTASFASEVSQRTGSFFSQEEQQRVVRLMRRGGKVAVRRGDLLFVAVLKPDSTWDLQLKVLVRGE